MQNMGFNQKQIEEMKQKINIKIEKVKNMDQKDRENLLNQELNEIRDGLGSQL